MRTFVAIDIPSGIRHQIRELLDVLQRAASPSGSNVRWSRSEGLHITLKFLGEVSPEKAEQIKTQLQSVRLADPLPIQVRGAGFFPNERAPRVIWVGIQAGPELAELARRIEESLAPLGIAKEDRPFSAHLTLGRLRAPDKLVAVRELLRQREPLEMGRFTAAEFYLYESQLAPGGSIYRRMARFPLVEATA
jgi:2'-5' RNA ligase